MLNLYPNPQQIFTVNKFVPVVILNDIEKAVPLAKALLSGGISIMEITLRTENALKIIEKIANEVPEMTVGAGTILNPKDYENAVKHKSQFIISPGLTRDLYDVSQNYDAAFLPGAVTASEVMDALTLGFTYLKFFPANSGYETLKALASPFPQVKFCPTGGINLDNARKFLDLPNIAAVGCSFLVNNDLIQANAFEQITANAKLLLKLL
jgi:2-dehydro-3-deoxyphosphogluconate aldolase / (4S)-4-hydroxy-2-oxoglutarate aldolase